MNEILTVIAMHTGDAAQAEQLCDWIFIQHQNQKAGHVLLVADGEVHAEMLNKVQLAAEVAFETATAVRAETINRTSRSERVNHLFRTAARVVATHYRLPWLWLEPDCVPLKTGWRATLADAYYSQPKRYLGAHLKTAGKEEGEIMLGRTAVYPAGAIVDIEPLCSGAALFNQVVGNQLVGRSTKSKLFQQINYHHENDCDKIRPEAVLLHSDKSGQLIRHLRAQFANRNGHSEVETPTVPPPKRRGRPPLNRAMTPVTV